MPVLTPQILQHGRAEPPPTPIALRAGPLTALYVEGMLRYIRLGKHEVLRAIYAAVRDHNWDTVPGHLSGVQIDAQADAFTVRFRSDHRAGPVDFGWTGTITGTADGTITFEFAGEAHATFRRNRIGFCVLHPMSSAGQPCTIDRVDGQRTESALPIYIEPHQPFKNIAAISHLAAPGVHARVQFEGDTFEMEDQRNWSDASFKTYCTPLDLPLPVSVEAGTRIQQSVTITVTGEADPESGESELPGTLTLGAPAGVTLPRLGLCAASHGEPLSPNAAGRLAALNLDHLRVDLPLHDAPETEQRLRRASAEAAALGVSLHLALRLDEQADADLSWLRALLDEIAPPVSVWLVYDRDGLASSAGVVERARQAVGAYAPDALFAAGTDANFTELNRNRPPLPALDRVTFAVNPQVHAFDNASLVETLATQFMLVATAHRFSAGKPVMVSPVTLKPRGNPNATGSESAASTGDLPRQVDVRQMSLLGAGWTLGSIKYLAESDLASITYYETTGWQGIMARDSGSPLPDQFYAIPGGVFPVYHAVADVGEFAGAEVIHCTASDPLRFEGLALRRDGDWRVFVVSFSPEPQTITLVGLAGPVTIQHLDASNAERAMREPEAFRAEASVTLTARADGLALELPPYAILRLDHATTAHD